MATYLALRRIDYTTGGASVHLEPGQSSSAIPASVATTLLGQGAIVAVDPASVATSAAYIVAPSGWDAGWQRAAANAGTSPARVAVLGDSIAQGSVASDILGKGWQGLIAAYLQGKYGKGAVYYGVQESATPNGLVSSYGGTAPWVFSSGWGGIVWGIGYTTSGAGATGVANWATFTTPAACTDIDLVYMDFGSGSFQYAVDGGAEQTINCNNNSYLARVALLTGGSNAVHTITLGNQSGSSKMLVAGIICYNSRTSGVHLARLAYGGGGLYDYGLTNGYPTDKLKALQGYGAATVGFGFPTQPHLAVLAMGVNDCQNAQGVEGFYKLLDRACRALRRGQRDCSLLFVIPSNPEPTSSEVTSGNFTNAAYWHMYAEAIYDVAAVYRAAVVDIHSKWGEDGVSQGFQTASQPHPTDAGHADIATALATLL